MSKEPSHVSIQMMSQDAVNLDLALDQIEEVSKETKIQIQMGNRADNELGYAWIWRYI